MSQTWKFGPPLPPVELPESSLAPDWQQAKPASIARALTRALERPHGNWYVADASRRLGETRPGTDNHADLNSATSGCVAKASARPGRPPAMRADSAACPAAAVVVLFFLSAAFPVADLAVCVFRVFGI